MKGTLTILTGTTGGGKSEKAATIRSSMENTVVVDEAERNWGEVEAQLQAGVNVVAIISTSADALHLNVWQHTTKGRGKQ